MFIRMGGVQAKLTETEREVEKARKESSTAREHFNDIKKQRFVPFSLLHPLASRLHILSFFSFTC